MLRSLLLAIALSLACAVSAGAQTILDAKEKASCELNPAAKAREICRLYLQGEGLRVYSITSPGSKNRERGASAEPQECLNYYTTLIESAKTLCAYKVDAYRLDSLPKQPEPKFLTGKITDQFKKPEPSTEGQRKEFIEALGAYKDKFETHEKHLGLLKGAMGKLEAAMQRYGGVPGFGHSVSVGTVDGQMEVRVSPIPQHMQYRDQLAGLILNTEKNCKGGGISNIPAVWYKGVNIEMSKYLRYWHRETMLALINAAKTAHAAVTEIYRVHGLTDSAARRIQDVKIPDGPKGNPVVGLAEHRDGSGPKDPAIEALITGGISKTAEAVGHKALRLAPTPVKVLDALTTAAVSRGREGQFDPMIMVEIGVAAFSLPAGMLTSAAFAIIHNDKLDAKSYEYYTRNEYKKVKGQWISPEVLSQGYCKQNEPKPSAPNCQTLRGERCP